MRLNLTKKNASSGLVASLGKFDGLHLGHRHILKQLVARAKQLDLSSAVICFYPHPAKVLTGKTPQRIFSLRQQIQGFAELGIDQIIFLKFDKKLAGLEAEDFIHKYFIQQWKVRELHIGPFASIGKNRKGNSAWLENYLENSPIKLKIVEPVSFDSERMSSNRLRDAIEAGNFDLVRNLTRREFSVLERVQHGSKLGRQLGFRTANLDLSKRVKPPYGVYAGYANIKSKIYKAVINFGSRPTVQKDQSVLSKEVFEAHLIDYQGPEFYGQFLNVEILTKLRDEKKFESLDQLKSQIAIDLKNAREYLEKTTEL